jgi:hypothetical protein
LHPKAAPTALFKKSNSKASNKASSSVVALICAKYENVKFNVVVADVGVLTQTMPSMPHAKTGVMAVTVSFTKTAMGNRVVLGTMGAVVMGTKTEGDLVGKLVVVGGAETGDVEPISVGSGVGALVYTMDMDMDMENDMDISICQLLSKRLLGKAKSSVVSNRKLGVLA